MINELGKARRSVRGSRKVHAALSEFEVIGDIAHNAFSAGGFRIARRF